MNQEQTNITTGKQIRHLRTQLGMTQEELAGELNVTRQALSNWERDVNEPDLNMLKKICFLFGVNMDDFAKEVITKMETYEKKEKLGDTMRNIKDTQNFLHSKELVRHLIGICNIKLDDVVIEIGPGKGIITNELAHKVSKVIAIEFDEELYEKLKNKFQSNNKVDIIYGDILNFTPRVPNYCVFSNIPFNITSEILNKFLSDKKNDKMFLIMQYEPFIKYAGNPYGAETLRSMLYKPFFDMDLKYRFDPSDFKPAPQARIVLASFERKQFPDVKKEEEKLYKDFLAYIYTNKGETFFAKIKTLFSSNQIKRVWGQIKIDKTTKISEVPYESILKVFKLFFLYGTDANKQLVVNSFNNMNKQNNKLQKNHRNNSKAKSWNSNRKRKPYHINNV